MLFGVLTNNGAMDIGKPTGNPMVFQTSISVHPTGGSRGGGYKSKGSRQTSAYSPPLYCLIHSFIYFLSWRSWVS